MFRSLGSRMRRRTVGFTVASLVAVALTAAYALAQEEKPKCYLMVCTGSVCVAQQIECPKPTQPAPPPEG